MLILVLLALAILIPLLRRPKDEMAITFVGITNNPVRSFRPVRLDMFGGTTGLCAVVRIQNVSSNLVLDYKATGIERLQAGQSVRQSSASADHFAGGAWSPGYACLFAAEWPPEVSTNQHWRLVVDISHQDRGVRKWLQSHFPRLWAMLPREGQHTIRSSEVDPSVPFVMPPSP